MSNIVNVINTQLSPISKPKGKGDDKGDNTDTNPQDPNGDTNGGDQGGGDTKGDTNGDTKGDTKGDTTKGDTSNSDPNGQGSDSNPTNSNGAGGTASKTPKELKDLIKQLLENGQGSELLDNNTAFDQAVADKIKEIESTLEPGERAYIVGNTTWDQINMVQQTSDCKNAVQPLLDEVREQTNYLRSSLRHMVRAMEHTNVVHGTRKGNFLSNRTLVDTALSLRNSRMPKRAFYNSEDQIDTSIACAICLDQSGSMGGSLMDATKMLMALCEPLDSIGGKVLAYGFRDGYRSVSHPSNSHRARDCENMIYDVFKNWNERFTTIKGRFAHTVATGGTPMADGIQFGLDSIKYRPEKHRILFVLTDGDPNFGHSSVIQWQQRVAKEMGVHIVGIGWGRYGTGVKTLYKDNVWESDIKDVPSALVSKLKSLLKERVKRKVAS